MILRLSVVAFGALLLSQAASAGDRLVVHGMAPTFGGGVAQRQVAIRTDDVDPADAASAAILLARIKHAADVVCSAGIGGKSTALAEKVAKCRVATVAQAVKEADMPALQAAAAGEDHS